MWSEVSVVEHRAALPEDAIVALHQWVSLQQCGITQLLITGGIGVVFRSVHSSKIIITLCSEWRNSPCCHWRRIKVKKVKKNWHAQIYSMSNCPHHTLQQSANFISREASSFPASSVPTIMGRIRNVVSAFKRAFFCVCVREMWCKCTGIMSVSVCFCVYVCLHVCHDTDNVTQRSLPSLFVFYYIMSLVYIGMCLWFCAL